MTATAVAAAVSIGGGRNVFDAMRGVGREKGAWTETPRHIPMPMPGPAGPREGEQQLKPPQEVSSPSGQSRNAGGVLVWLAGSHLLLLCTVCSPQL